MTELPLIKRGNTKTAPFVADSSNAGPRNTALRTDALMPYLKTLPKVSVGQVATKSDDLPGSLHKTAVTLRIIRESIIDMTPKPGAKIAGAAPDKMRWSLGKGRVRHNSTCELFDPKRPCKANVGKPCPKCGG